ncbi:hypothetical protein GGF46_000288 [Coemansia sp. RSA 552]|nr:hypothetical protein GGF46_000288 [Coemansia sp. RSA 552]
MALSNEEVKAKAREIMDSVSFTATQQNSTSWRLIPWIRYCEASGRLPSTDCTDEDLRPFSDYCIERLSQGPSRVDDQFISSNQWLDTSPAALPAQSRQSQPALSSDEPDRGSSGSQSSISSSLGDTGTATHCTCVRGTVAAFDKSLMDVKWRKFSRESEIFINCVLMRRSSYCSLEMRAWYLLSMSTWFDADTMRNGITLGSLKLQKRSPGSSAVGHTITIRTRANTPPAPATDSDSTDFAPPCTRNKRSVEAYGQMKAEVLRHKRIPLCPWNALAMLLFYKWHVRKEPQPNFVGLDWMDEPLFHTGPTLRDDDLAEICGSLYDEFLEAVGEGWQSHKYMNNLAFDEISTALGSSKLLRNTVSAARNMHVTRRVLQNGYCESIQLANAGFSPEAEDKRVPRQSHSVLRALEERIFPFADELPDLDHIPDAAAKFEMRGSIVSFCNTLKLLREVLLQDMAILFDVPFYQRMLKGTAVMSTDIFQAHDFVSSTDNIRDTSWESDFLPLVSEQPRDPSISRVRPHAPEEGPRAQAAPELLLANPEQSTATPGSSPASSESRVVKVRLRMGSDAPKRTADSAGLPNDDASTLVSSKRSCVGSVTGAQPTAASTATRLPTPCSIEGDKDKPESGTLVAYVDSAPGQQPSPEPYPPEDDQDARVLASDDTSAEDHQYQAEEAAPLPTEPTAESAFENSQSSVDKVSEWIGVLAQNRDIRDIEQSPKSATSSKSSNTAIACGEDAAAENPLLAEVQELRAKARQADKVIGGMRNINEQLKEAASIHEAMSRKISRLVKRQGAVEARPDGENTTEKLVHRLTKVQSSAHSHAERVKSIMASMEILLEEATAEPSKSPRAA